MLDAYRPLFTTRRARCLVVASLLGRSAMGIIAVPLVLLAQEVSGSYTVAGVALGVQAAGVATSGPLRGRLLDRFGSRVLVPPLVLVQSGALVGLPFVAETGAEWPIVVLAGVVGTFAPPLPAGMRLEWQGLLGRGDSRLAQAYAFESLAQATLFVIGPAIAGIGIAVVGAGATLGVTGGVALVGGMAFALQASKGGQRTQIERGWLGSMRFTGVQTLVLVTLLADTSLGVIDVAVVAFAQQRDEAAAGGLLLAAFSASSVLAGTAYGARSWTAPAEGRLLALTGMAAVAYAALTVADSLLILACLLLLAGAPFAAQWATTSLLLDRVTPAHSAAEAYSWLSTANSAGIALGSLVGGSLIELAGTRAGFLAAAGAVALAAVVIVSRRATLDVVASPREDCD